MDNIFTMKRAIHLSEEEHLLVTQAVAQAEQATDGEIVTIVANISDAYRETAYVVASLCSLAILASFALLPDFCEGLIAGLSSSWDTQLSPASYVAWAGSAALLGWLMVWGILHWMPLRLLLTLPAVKKRMVHARALDLFRVGTEARTKGQTGILIYLSLKERRAEIIADSAISDKVAPEVWGDALLALLKNTKNGQPGAGLAEAVRQVGAVLAEHIPRKDSNPNELPDRLIEL